MLKDRKGERRKEAALHHLLQQNPCEKLKCWQKYIHLHQMLVAHPPYLCCGSQVHACFPAGSDPTGPSHCVPETAEETNQAAGI